MVGFVLVVNVICHLDREVLVIHGCYGFIDINHTNFSNFSCLFFYLLFTILSCNPKKFFYLKIILDYSDVFTFCVRYFTFYATRLICCLIT